MARLIDADALIHEIDECGQEGTIANYVRGVLKATLSSIPAVDAEPVRKWISVKDRLPTYAELRDDHVLVLFEDLTICSTGFDECIEGESIFGEWRQNFDMETLGATDSDWMPFEGVTHWMPLPSTEELDET